MYENSCKASVLMPDVDESVSRSSTVCAVLTGRLARAVADAPRMPMSAAPEAETPSSLSMTPCSAGGTLMPSVSIAPLMTSDSEVIDELLSLSACV